MFRSPAEFLQNLMNSIPEKYQSYQSNPTPELKTKLIEQCKQAVAIMNSTNNNFDFFLEMALPQQILDGFAEGVKATQPTSYTPKPKKSN